MEQTPIAKMRAAITAEREKFERRAGWTERVFSELPESLPAVPTMSNEGDRAHLEQPGAWLSWRTSYGDKWTGGEILRALEGAGFEPLPLTLCKWDDWRRNVEPAAQSDIPDTKPSGRSTYKLTDSQPIAPLWVVPSQHSDGEAICFYRSPAGLVLRVMVQAPGFVSINARRKGGGNGKDWFFERGSAKVQHPQAWHSINTPAGEPVANISAHTFACVDTEQGLSGAVYFDPYTDQAEFPLTPAQLWEALNEAAKPREVTP